MTITAPVDDVWEALVTPAAIKAYMFGTTVTLEWVVGSPIVWTGEWQGRQDRGQGDHSSTRLRACPARKRSRLGHWFVDIRAPLLVERQKCEVFRYSPRS